jgi:hypothetical protein
MPLLCVLNESNIKKPADLAGFFIRFLIIIIQEVSQRQCG